MDTAMVIDLGRQALWTALLVCAPLLLVALVIRCAWAIWGAFRGVGLEAELRI